MPIHCPESRQPARHATNRTEDDRFRSGNQSVLMILSCHDSVSSAKNVTARRRMLRRDVTAWTPIILNRFGHCYAVTARRGEAVPPRLWTLDRPGCHAIAPMRTELQKVALELQLFAVELRQFAVICGNLHQNMR